MNLISDGHSEAIHKELLRLIMVLFLKEREAEQKLYSWLKQCLLKTIPMSGRAMIYPLNYLEYTL